MADAVAPFLAPAQLRAVRPPEGFPFTIVGLALGSGPSALEVLITRAPRSPASGTIRSAWHAYQNRRPAPLVLVTLHGDHAALCGPVGPEPPVILNADMGQAERICREALRQPDRHAAIRLLSEALPLADSPLPGIRNEGLLATHELSEGIRRTREWQERWETASHRARGIVNHRDRELLQSLGYQIERLDNVTDLLRATAGGQRVALAVLLRDGETADLGNDRFNSLSPISYALAVADRENIPYVIVTQGSTLRLYPVQAKGVGQRGRTETFIEVHTSLLRDTEAAYLWLLFSAEALAEGGTFSLLLNESQRFAGDLAERLRDRIYAHVVPILAEGLAAARNLRRPTAAHLAETYEMAMTVLFRLLFIAYAEDKDLLPYKHNQLYRDRSLKKKAQDLLAMRRDQVAFDDSDSLWTELDLLFRAIERGKSEWAIAEYDGGLFSREEEVSPVGAKLAELSLPNTTMGEVLFNLLCIDTQETQGWGPVDFRSLGVGEFGTIYEGLLESELAVAQTDLAVDSEGHYRPALANEEPVVRQNRIYLHDRSGKRKSSGSYFTKKFAVDHLLDHALEPALREHLERLRPLNDDQAAERFFDFRVADIAMGSGHFLVAATDRIEHAFTRYLAERPLPGVRAELASLKASALETLGPLAESVGAELEDTKLLRRLIARRCIYGVDINPVSVNLARLSIWIHTFVPGLPLSLLDHNLVVGNSLVGIGRVEELRREEEEGIFSGTAEEFIGEALAPLSELARLADRTATEVRRARTAMRSARKRVGPAEAYFTIVTAARIRGEDLPRTLATRWQETREDLVGSRLHMQALSTLKGLDPLHFPIAFPEVFLRKRSGFDVILGNPPWKEAKPEEDAFWARHSPGFKSLPQRRRNAERTRLRNLHPDLITAFERESSSFESLRRALVSGSYPGMGIGDPDLYKGFCWRFWSLAARDGGAIGVVLPRSTFSVRGSAQFRTTVMRDARSLDITILLNSHNWVFPEVESRYTIGLCIIRKGPASGRVTLRGPFESRASFLAGIREDATVFSVDDIVGWTDTAAIPLLPSERSLRVFSLLRQSERLDKDSGGWYCVPLSEEIHSRKDQRFFRETFDAQTDWPVYKGESFDLWTPDTGIYYGWMNAEEGLTYLFNKRLRGSRLEASPFFAFRSLPKVIMNRSSLPCQSARIAIRRVTNRTNQRTILAALVPPKVFLADQASCLLWPRGLKSDVAYVLGVLCSLPLDWYARRFVETDVRMHIVRPLPIPRRGESTSLRRRVSEVSARLAAVDDRFGDWAREVGVECGPVDEEMRFALICELDAVVAHLYGLEESHLRHIFETFHEGWEPGTSADHHTLGDYNHRLLETMRYYRQWAGR